MERARLRASESRQALLFLKKKKQKDFYSFGMESLATGGAYPPYRMAGYGFAGCRCTGD
jgi:hypothetical protein